MIVSQAGRGWWGPTSDAKGDVFWPGTDAGARAELRPRSQMPAGFRRIIAKFPAGGQGSAPKQHECVAERWTRRKAVWPILQPRAISPGNGHGESRNRMTKPMSRPALSVDSFWPAGRQHRDPSTRRWHGGSAYRGHDVLKLPEPLGSDTSIPPNLAFQRQNVAVLIPCLRHTSAVESPASRSRSTATICCSETERRLKLAANLRKATKYGCAIEASVRGNRRFPRQTVF